MKEWKQTEIRIPANTWNKQNVNAIKVKIDKGFGNFDAKETYPNIIEKNIYNEDKALPYLIKLEKTYELSSSFNVVGLETQKIIERNANFLRLFEIPENIIIEKPLKISFDTNDSKVINERIVLIAKKNCKVKVIIDFNNNFNHSGYLSVFAEDNAEIEIFYVQNLSNISAHNAYINGFAEDNAVVKLNIIEVGAKNPNVSVHFALVGHKSELDANILYLGDEKRNIDIASRVDIIGKEAVANIFCKGILLDECKKTLRDTLLFVNGAKGSKGKEIEHVLMLSPFVKNVSVPILLCGEEDVEGEHATSSGKIDDKSLFYMMSRGISESEAKKLIAWGAFASVINNIDDDAIKKSIEDKVEMAVVKGVENE